MSKRDQMGLFDAGERAKEKGMAVVMSHTPLSYAMLFEQTAIMLLHTMGEFTSEDVTAEIGQPPNGPNAVGALTNGLVRRVGLEPVRMVKGKRQKVHAALITVWRRKPR